MQPDEQAGQIFVLIVDETYGKEDEAHGEESERFRCSLEAEFGTKFQEANVGPSADLPAFLTIIATTSVPTWTLLLNVFFMGKPIKENLGVWVDIAKQLRSFFSRRVVLARNGAAALAVEAVLDELEGLAKTIRLLSYRSVNTGDQERLEDRNRSDGIHDSPPTLYLGQVIHIFEIEADGVLFRVSVNGKNCSVIRL